MKFIVDQQLPPALAKWLVSRGHSAEHVRNIGLRDADDREIWERAEREGAIVISKDEDFAALRRLTGEGPALVWLRIGNVTTPALLTRLEVAWPEIELALLSGRAFIEVR